LHSLAARSKNNAHLAIHRKSAKVSKSASSRAQPSKFAAKEKEMP